MGDEQRRYGFPTLFKGRRSREGMDSMVSIMAEPENMMPIGRGHDRKGRTT
jgi:hypothetical protein